MNKKLLFISMLLIFGLLLAACGGGAGQSPEATPVSSNAAEEGASTDPGSGDATVAVMDIGIDPANLSSENATDIVAYLYEGLVRIQDDGAITGLLAGEVVVSEDGLDYIFTLRQGVAFQDGSLLNSDVVVWNFNRWFDPADANRGDGEYSAWAANFGGFKGEVTEDGLPKSEVDGIEKVDEFSFIIHLNTPDADFLNKMADPAFSVISPKTLVGTGPYMAASSDGDSLTLEPFAGYWNAASIPSEGMQVPAP